jgi:hypothetical protein
MGANILPKQDTVPIMLVLHNCKTLETGNEFAFVRYRRKKLKYNETAIHRLQESAWFGEEGSIAQYSHRALV